MLRRRAMVRTTIDNIYKSTYQTYLHPRVCISTRKHKLYTRTRTECITCRIIEKTCGQEAQTGQSTSYPCVRPTYQNHRV